MMVFPSFLGFGVGGWSYSNSLASAVATLNLEIWLAQCGERAQVHAPGLRLLNVNEANGNGPKSMFSKWGICRKGPVI